MLFKESLNNSTFNVRVLIVLWNIASCSTTFEEGHRLTKH